MKLCDLTIERYLYISQGWSWGVWLAEMAVIGAAVFLWKRWRARVVAARNAELEQSFPPLEPPADAPTIDGPLPGDDWPRCPVCASPCSADLVAFAKRNVYVKGDWEENLPP